MDVVKIKPIGYVRTVDAETARIELDETHLEGLSGLSAGDRLDILYWMHELGEEKRRAMLVHPRGDTSRPKKGVFALRSPMRPNPVGVSLVTVAEVQGNVLLVRGLDAHDGSPVIDIKSARRNSDAARLVEMWGETHHTIVSALQDELGRERLLTMLRDPIREAGRATPERGLTDARRIGRAIMDIEELWNIRGSVLEDTPERFTRRVDECPWSSMPPLGCEVFVWWMEGFVRGCNGDYNYSLDKSIPAGDEACIWSVYRSD